MKRALFCKKIYGFPLYFLNWILLSQFEATWPTHAMRKVSLQHIACPEHCRTLNMASTSFSKELLLHDKLAEAVKQFRCLYDKSLKDYKDKHTRNSAWTKVAELADMEQGEYLYAKS